MKTVKFINIFYLFLYIFISNSISCIDATPASSSRKLENLLSDIEFKWYSPERQKQISKAFDFSDKTKKSGHGKRVEVLIKVEKNETVDLYSKWSGISKSALMKMNPEIEKTGIKEGDAFTFIMSSDQEDDFFTSRNLYHLSMQRETMKKPEIEKTIPYTIKEKETITDILLKFPETNLDLLEKLNSNKYIPNLRPGDTIKIPIVKKKNGKKGSSSDIKIASAETVNKESGGNGKSKPQTRNLVKYRVKPGESAWFIAVKIFHISVEDLQKFNSGKDLSSLYPDEEIWVPAAKNQ
jgi:LysM repeat protein